MGTRKFNKMYNDEDIFDAFSISKRLIDQINYYLEHEELSEIERNFLEESKKTIQEIIDKYGSVLATINKISREQLSYGFNVMYNNSKYENMSVEESNAEYYNSSETLKQVKKDFEKIFEIEDSIHKLITLPLWKKYITSMETEIETGGKFAYIVHSGRNFIYLPGAPDYKKTRNLDGDYVSASLLTDKQMAMFNDSQVGLIIEPNDAIMCATSIDSGTNITSSERVRGVMELDNGRLCVCSGFPGKISRGDKKTTTKIQSPGQVEAESIERQKENPLSSKSEDVNEVVIDDSKIKVIGVFFKTTGCEINLNDYERALIMAQAYNVPIKLINKSIYRKKMGLDPYEREEYQRYSEEIKYWQNPENWDFIKQNPQGARELLENYFTDIVINGKYEKDIKEQIEDIFTKMIEYSYRCNDRNDGDITPQQ